MADLVNKAKIKAANTVRPGSTPLPPDFEAIEIPVPPPISPTPPTVSSPDPQPPSSRVSTYPPAIDDAPEPPMPVVSSPPSDSLSPTQFDPLPPTQSAINFTPSFERDARTSTARPEELTPQEISNAITLPGLQTRQAEQDAFRQRESDTIANLSQQQYSPYIYEPPTDFISLGEGAAQRQAMFDNTMRQDVSNARQAQAMSRAMAASQSGEGSVGDGLDWIRSILGQRDGDNNRKYLSPVTFNKQTQSYEGNGLGAVLYPLGVIQNTLMGGALDARYLVRKLGENVPPWWRDNVGGWFQKNAKWLVDSPPIQFINNPNKYDDDKVNIIEALRGAQYSFSDDAGEGLGIGTQAGATKIDLGGVAKVPFNPTKLGGFGLDVVLGFKVDKLAAKGLNAIGIGTKASAPVPVNTARAAQREALTRLDPGTPTPRNPVAESYQQLPLPLTDSAGKAVRKPVSTPPKDSPGFKKANKAELKRQQSVQMAAAAKSGDQLTLPELAEYAERARKQSAKLGTTQDYRRYNYKKTPEYAKAKASLPSIARPKPTPPAIAPSVLRTKLNPAVTQQFKKAERTGYLERVNQQIIEKARADAAWEAEVLQRPLAYKEYISRRADGQLVLPLDVKSVRQPAASVPPKQVSIIRGKQGSLFNIPAKDIELGNTPVEVRNNPLAHKSYTSRRADGQTELPLGVKSEPLQQSVKSADSKVAKTKTTVYQPQLQLFPKARTITELASQVSEVKRITARAPNVVRQLESVPLDTSAKIKLAQQISPKLPSSPVGDVVNATADVQIAKAVHAVSKSGMAKADEVLQSTTDIGRRLVDGDKLDAIPSAPQSVLFEDGALPLLADLADEPATHATRVKGLSLENADPLEGSARHEMGTAHYSFVGETARTKALLGGGKVSDNLPPLITREFGENVSLHNIKLSGKTLDAKMPSASLTEGVRQLVADFPEVVEAIGSEPKALISIFDDISASADEETALALQRRVVQSLRDSGVSHARAGDVVATFNQGGIRTENVVDNLANDLSAEEIIALRSELEAEVAEQTGSQFSRSTAADSSTQRIAQSIDSAEVEKQVAQQKLVAAVRKSGLMDDMPPPTHTPAAKPNLVEVTERIAKPRTPIEGYAEDLLAERIKPSNTAEFRELVSQILDDTLDLPPQDLGELVALLESKHSKLYDRVADALFETKYVDYLPESVRPVAEVLDATPEPLFRRSDLSKMSIDSIIAKLPKDQELIESVLKTENPQELLELLEQKGLVNEEYFDALNAIDDEAFDRAFDSLAESNTVGGKTGNPISPCD